MSDQKHPNVIFELSDDGKIKFGENLDDENLFVTDLTIEKKKFFYYLKVHELSFDGYPIKNL